MLKFAANLIKTHRIQESFYIADLQVLKHNIQEWKRYLPMIQSHYAVKCNPNKEIMKVMIDNDLGFDCASQKEIETVLKLGVKPKNVIFAHPVKSIKDLEYAIKAQVSYTTFDSLSELEKIKYYAPNMKCLIRLKVDNPSARIQLGLKYGVANNEYQDLIRKAKELQLDLVGSSFHVGSYSKDPVVFDNAIKYSREVMDFAKKIGYSPNLLDIGGGFTNENFADCADVIRKSIIKYGFDKPHIKLISEPGRFYASNVFTFFSPVIGYKYKNNKHEYFIRDGIYGSFNGILYDEQKPVFEYLRNPLFNKDTDDTLLDSIIQGATCDSLDCMGSVKLPYLKINDFIVCRNFGAYTSSGAKDFNGIPMSNLQTFYIGNR
jgi:ornithine decarboxylase